ncbi:MAG: NERD domain-containing protein [Gammaproteobacteria bacterium]|nr:NERD domain-containing protein [Gammaproteobacteria bacterium]
MTEYFPADQSQWAMLAGAALLLLLGYLIYRLRRGGNQLERVLDAISHDQIDHLLIPNGDEGEIQIDRLLLTPKGLLIVDIKDVVGTVFGSDKMQEWTVISKDRRYTFSNPQPALYDRIAAVRQIVRQVPVSGRILFLEGADFTKGVPNMVCDLDDLMHEYGDQDENAAKVKVEAFKPHWDLIRKEALDAQVGAIISRRSA